MEFTKDIYFDNGPVAGKESKITYSGSLFANGSNNVNIVYGFGEAWNNTTTQPMEKTDKGFVASIRMRNFDTFNFCFSDENNNWDNNNYYNYISPILPEVKDEVKEEKIDFGKDYSASIDDIIDDILGNTTKQDIISNKDNSSIDKILESINKEALPEIEALFNDLFFESVKEDEKVKTSVQEISMEPELAEELKEVGKVVENSQAITYTPASVENDNAELIRLFNELFEVSNETISFKAIDEVQEAQPTTAEEPKLNVASFNIDGLVSDLLEPVIASDTYAEKADETSLFEDLKAHEDDQENSLALINSGEFTVASRKLGYFYKLRKRIRLAILKIAKIPKDFVKQLGL